MTENYNLYDGITDSHFHQLEMRKKGLDPHTVLDNCFRDGLSAAVDISTNTDTFYERLEFAEQFSSIFISAGLSVGKAEHDLPVIERKLTELEIQLETNKNNPKLKALGETGLDFYWNYGTEEKQKFLLESQLLLADRYSLPVIIHNREADSGIIELLQKIKPLKGGIIHCFSSDRVFAEKYLDLGFMISFAGNITYKKTESMREAASIVPLDSILVETDAPYLTPQKVRKFPNHPGFIGYTYELIAEIKGIKAEELVRAVNTNFRKIFDV